MTLSFFKYQGTGNDFILLDNRNNQYHWLQTAQIAFLCNRHMGIGADGLMLLQNSAGVDFGMKYYNADGRESSMCGNGGRCMVAFAHALGMHQQEYHFMAIDGLHKASYANGIVNLQMQDVKEVKQENDHFILNTGSPHYVVLTDRVR